jgi:hypothetical protein
MRKLVGPFLTIALLSPLSSAWAQDCGLMPAGQQEDSLNAAGLDPADRRHLSSDLKDLRDAVILLQDYGQTSACAMLAEAVTAIVANPTVFQDRTRVAFDAAQPFGERAEAVAVSDLLGRTLVGMSGRDVGRVEDLWLDTSARPGLFLVGLRGPLGISVGHIAVPAEVVRFGQNGRVYLGLTTAELDRAPRFDDRLLLADAEWRAANEAFYSEIVSSPAF